MASTELVIHKFEFPVNGNTLILKNMEKEFKVVRFGFQPGDEPRYCLWVQRAPDWETSTEARKDYPYVIVPTGKTQFEGDVIPMHVGTHITDTGYVWHCFFILKMEE